MCIFINAYYYRFYVCIYEYKLIIYTDILKNIQVFELHHKCLRMKPLDSDGVALNYDSSIIYYLCFLGKLCNIHRTNQRDSPLSLSLTLGMVF